MAVSPGARLVAEEILPKSRFKGAVSTRKDGASGVGGRFSAACCYSRKW